MSKTTEERILRLEILNGLAEIPTKWGITDVRLRHLRDVTGWSLEGCRKALIERFGEAHPLEAKEKHWQQADR